MWQRWARAVTVAVMLALSAGVCLAADSDPPSDQPRVLRYAPDSAQPLSRQQLLAIYLGRLTTWPDGTPITVFVLPDRHPVHEQFCRSVLGTYPYVLRAAWDRLVYTGTGFAPVQVRNEQDMARRVSVTPGAIGYIGGRLEPSQQMPAERSSDHEGEH